MGIWRRIFGNRSETPSRGQWEQIATAISKGMEVVITFWFMECKIAVASLDKDAVKKNLDLSGDTLFFAKSFQLYNVYNFIAQNKYISESDGRDFADLLLEKVLGDKASESIKHFTSFKVNSEKQALVVSDHMCKFITDSTNIFYSAAIVPTLIQLVAETNIVVATKFGDIKTSEKIARHMGPRRLFK